MKNRITMVELTDHYIEKCQLLNNNLSEYIHLIDYDGNGEEFIFTFEGKAKTNWAIEKFGEDEGSIFEWTSDEIHELLEKSINSKECTTHDKIFLDHLISFLSDENATNDSIDVTPEMSDEIEKIRVICKEIVDEDIGWREWGGFFEKKGYSTEVNMMTRITIKLPKFNFVVDNKKNSGVPSEVSFYEGLFAGWVES